MAVTQSDAAAAAASPRPAPPTRVTRNRFLRQAVGGLAIAAVGLKTVGEQTARAAVTFGETVSGAGAFGLKILNSSNAFGATGLHASLTATNPGDESAAVYGLSKGTSPYSNGVRGSNAGSGNGVYGSAVNGVGVRGLHSATTGVNPGVRGDTSSVASNAVAVLGTVTASTANTHSAGVKGVNNGTDNLVYGVHGTTVSSTGAGVRGDAPHIGVMGSSTGDGGYGLFGEAFVESGTGVFGHAAAEGVAFGVVGESTHIGVSGRNPLAYRHGHLGTSTAGVVGERLDPSTSIAVTRGKLGTGTEGVIGEYTPPSTGLVLNQGLLGTAAEGVFGSAKTGTGVRGLHSATTGVAPGVRGDTNARVANAVAVLGTVTAVDAGARSAGVKGVNSGTGSGVAFGVLGTALAGNGAGVRGEAPSYGVSGKSTGENGTGAYGEASGEFGTGVYGLATHATGANAGVVGRSSSAEGIGVLGDSGHIAVSGTNYLAGRRGHVATTYEGVLGESFDPATETVLTQGQLGTTTEGVFGFSTVANGSGVVGAAHGTGLPVGIFGSSATGHAGYFDGKVHITGNLSLDGAISAPTKHFVIDHPLDPANQYLTHASIESSEPLTDYTGNIALDDDGTATVALPAWFEALNGDCRYQLTAIGSAQPNLHVAQTISANRFTIAGGTAGSQVSWRITGVRRDAWVLANPMQVERTKPVGERGTYLHPEAHGQAKDAGTATTQLRARETAMHARP